MAMNARMRRITSDYEQVRKDFAGHKFIMVTPEGPEPPEKYHVTYFVNGIYLLPDGRVETLARHEVEIILHSEYPRYKPVCRILTPIWHPNFRDGQICIGDIWGAGESLTDIIVNIGDMIQYKSWNSFSPLSADAAKWAIENKHLFPVGTAELHIADYASAKDSVNIDLFDDAGDVVEEAPVENVAEAPQTEAQNVPQNDSSFATPFEEPKGDGNDFDITAEELAGIEFVPSASRMQTMAVNTVKGGGINIKTIFMKGLLWALIGAILGFVLTEVFGSSLLSNSTAARLSGNSELAYYYELTDTADAYWDELYGYFEDYCSSRGIDPDSETGSDAFVEWAASSNLSAAAQNAIENYLDYNNMADEELYRVFENMYDIYGEAGALNRLTDMFASVTRTHSAMWSAMLALFIGLFLGLGEGIFYGSGEKATKYALIGAGVSLVIGYISGYLAQFMYAEILSDSPDLVQAAFIRGLGWAIMGLGIGVAVGLIKLEGRRILFCSLGGLTGGFFGGFLFDFICDIIPNDVIARGVGIVIMGILIGLGVGFLEQVAKQAWLKVIRGEFEGKEYLVFAGVTSIGNTGKNTIVLFKDKLVGPHHCDIVLEGKRYVLVDCGTPMGTVVNGRRTIRQELRNGDVIALGNSVLVFNTK